MALVYRRFGGSTHVRCDTFAQLKEAVLIPETQYVAVAAPVASFVVDPGFLRSLDTDTTAASASMSCRPPWPGWPGCSRTTAASTPVRIS